MSEEPRVLYYLEHAIQDLRVVGNNERRVISKQMQFVEINAQGEAQSAGLNPIFRLPTTEWNKNQW